MNDNNLSRRNFAALTTAALGGVAAAASLTHAADTKDEHKLSVDPALMLKEPHVCKGLSTCKGHDGKESNACAGQGVCATAGSHTCHTANDCAGQGGCGGYPGQNTCKGKGKCAVPLKKDAWTLARKQFEELMADMGKKVGAAPKG